MYSYSPFRNAYTPEKTDDSCNFCDDALMQDNTLYDSSAQLFENEHYRWVFNAYPKFNGHTMLIPKRHFTTIDAETEDEIISRHALLVTASNVLQKVFPDAGIEVFLQTGSQSNSSVAHLHWHVVPAKRDDPLRSFEKLGHFYTTKPNEEKVVLFPIPIKLACRDLQKAIAQI